MSNLIFTVSEQVYLLNVALASIVTCGLGLLVARVCRTQSAPLLHGLLLSAVCVTALSPMLVLLADPLGVGLVRIASNGPEPAHGPSYSGKVREANAPASLPDAAQAAGRPLMEVSTESPSASRVLEPPPMAGSSAWQISRTVAALVWGGGLIVHLMLFFRGQLVLRRLRRSLVPLQCPQSIEVFAIAMTELGVRRKVQLFESSLAPTPLSFGLWKPAIVLPTGLAGELTGEQLRLVFLHEAAHIVRHDHWMAFVQWLTRTIFWWNPLLQRVDASLERLREQICDDYAVATGEGRGFAELLLQIATWTGPCGSTVPGTTALLNEAGNDLEERIARVLKRRSICIHLSRVTKLGVGAFAIMSLGLIFVARVRADEKPQRQDGAVPAKTQIYEYVTSKTLGNADRVNDYRAIVEPAVAGFFEGFTISGDQIRPRLLHCEVVVQQSQGGANSRAKEIDRYVVGERLKTDQVPLFTLDNAIGSIIENEINDRLLDEFFKTHGLAPGLAEFKAKVDQTPAGVQIVIQGSGGSETTTLSGLSVERSDPYTLDQTVDSLRRNRRDQIGVTRFLDKLAEFTTPSERERFFPADSTVVDRDSRRTMQLKERVTAFLRSRARIRVEEPEIVSAQRALASKQAGFDAGPKLAQKEGTSGDKAVQAAAAARPDLAGIQGTWELVGGETDGEPIPAEAFEILTFVFDGEKFRVVDKSSGQNETTECSFKLDPTKNPKTIDTISLDGSNKGEAGKGIYDLKGDTLKLCAPLRKGLGRPTEFKTAKGSGLGLLELKRVKSTDARPKAAQKEGTSGDKVAQATAPKPDAQAIQGTWRLIKGKPPKGMLKSLFFEFDGENVGLGNDEGSTDEFPFKLDPTKNPKALDITLPHGDWKLIYELKADELKLCLPNKPKQDRPTEFKSAKGSQFNLVLRRSKSTAH